MCAVQTDLSGATRKQIFKNINEKVDTTIIDDKQAKKDVLIAP